MNLRGQLSRLVIGLLLVGALGGCVSPDMPGYQKVYQSYRVPPELMALISAKLAENGLSDAAVSRDNVGRVRLVGSYANDDDVERAFVIVHSIAGLKSTSPFYPDDVKVKQADLALGRAMREYAETQRRAVAPARKRALVVGINTFLDNRHLPPIQGEDDARVVLEQLKSRGYLVTALLGPQATKAAIEQAVVRISGELGPNDDLMIYVSSHGTPPVPSPRGGEDRRMSIVAYDSGDVGTRRSADTTDFLLNLQATSVRDTVVQELAQRATLVTRVLIDTCYSGEILRGIPDAGGGYALQANGGREEQAGVALSSWSGPQYASKGIRAVTNATAPAASAPADAGRSLPPVDRRRSGYTIITATSEGQRSLGPAVGVGVFPSPLEPRRSLRGSFFTQSFFEYLASHDGQVEDAFIDARRFTEAKALVVSGGRDKQVPRHFSTIPAAENNLYR